MTSIFFCFDETESGSVAPKALWTAAGSPMNAVPKSQQEESVLDVLTPDAELPASMAFCCKTGDEEGEAAPTVDSARLLAQAQDSGRCDYGDARADAVAKEARDLCVALNDDKRSDDRAMAAAQLLDVADAAKVSVMAVDRLGLDLRVKRAGGTTEEYRLAYRAAARSVEDAKSEINKLLQEAWELDQGVVFDGAYDDKPKVVQRAVSSLK